VIDPFLLEPSTNKKNGAPSSAVTTPIEISCGAKIVRAKTSAKTKNIPP
jgi:hypothetical protein